MDPWQGDALDVMLGLRADEKWACFEYAEWVSRQNGKGALGEARVLIGFLGPLAERLILWSAHEYKTAMEAFRRIGWLLRNLGERKGDNLILIGEIPIKVINTNGEESYERLDTGQRVRFVARTKGSGRGFTADCNLIDESFAYEFLHQSAMMPTLSAVRNPQIIYLSSPPLNGFTGEVMFQLRKRAAAGGDASLGYRDWGLAGDLEHLDAVDLDDPANFAAANPALGIRITRETVERERRSMSPIDFARERLGIWPADLTAGHQVIPSDDWSQAMDRASRPVAPLVFSAAVALDRSNAAIGLVGARADGARHVEVIEAGAGAGWVVPSLVRLVAAHRPAAVVVDEFGPTGSLIPELEQAGVKVERIGTADAARAFGMFYDGICGRPYEDAEAGTTVDPRNLRHLGQDELTAAVAGAVKRSLGDGSAWDRKNASVDITPLVAVTNANWGFAHFGQRQEVVPMVAWR